MTDNTNGKERKELVRWMFVGIAAHPETRSLAPMPLEVAVKTDQFMASLFTRLVVEACPKEVSALIKEQGPEGMKRAFEALGQVAVAELYGDSAVNSRMGAFLQLLDQQKFRHILAPAK